VTKRARAGDAHDPPPAMDEVDRITDAWRRERPDLDVAPLDVLSRVSRLARHLDRARSAGARVHAAVQRDWGGYSGYFSDPDGFRWEIAHNPFPVGEVRIP